jgi:hypothetical protein
MLSLRNELILVGALIFYLAFVPRLQIVRELLSTSIGKAAALAAIVYVYKYVSCSAALLLVIAYVRCGCINREMFTTPTTTVQPTVTCPDGYAYDSVSKECKPSSSMSGSVPPGMPISTVPSTMGAGSPIDTTPGVNTTMPMTTPMPTMPSMPSMTTSGGVQPSMSSSSSVAPI